MPCQQCNRWSWKLDHEHTHVMYVHINIDCRGHTSQLSMWAECWWCLPLHHCRCKVIKITSEVTKIALTMRPATCVMWMPLSTETKQYIADYLQLDSTLIGYTPTWNEEHIENTQTYGHKILYTPTYVIPCRSWECVFVTQVRTACINADRWGVMPLFRETLQCWFALHCVLFLVLHTQILVSTKLRSRAWKYT